MDAASRLYESFEVFYDEWVQQSDAGIDDLDFLNVGLELEFLQYMETALYQPDGDHQVFITQKNAIITLNHLPTTHPTDASKEPFREAFNAYVAQKRKVIITEHVLWRGQEFVYSARRAEAEEEARIANLDDTDDDAAATEIDSSQSQPQI